MAISDSPGGDLGRKAAGKPAAGELSLHHQSEGSTRTESGALSGYSFSSPEFGRSMRQITLASLQAPEVPSLLKPHAASPEIPALLRAPASVIPTVGAPEKPPGPEPAPIPVAPAEQMEDKSENVTACKTRIVLPIPSPADMPKAMDSVKDRDPELYKQIQAKVTDPRYTGEMGNITVSTHDKRGQVNGCEYIQNVPYWESGPAVKAMVDVNNILATKGLRLKADSLNGAGRTRGQEEAIVWRNSGLHAKVGRSNHGFGKAEDFEPDPDPTVKKQLWDDPFVNATLHAHGWRHGDSWGPLSNDLHHWSFVGPGPATDGHAPPHKPVHSKHHSRR